MSSGETFATPPHEQSSFGDTTLYGTENESVSGRKRRKRRSIGRRVSFAEAPPSLHIFTRDDDYETPSRDGPGNSSNRAGNRERRSPRIAAMNQNLYGDDKENQLPIVLSRGTDRGTRKGKRRFGNADPPVFSPALRPENWLDSRDNGTLASEDGDNTGPVDLRHLSDQPKDCVVDEADITLDSTTFNFKLSELANQDMWEEQMATRSSKVEDVRRSNVSATLTSTDHDMSLTMIRPVLRARPLELQTGPGEGNADVNTDMSITMQVPRRSILAGDDDNKAQVLQILMASLPANNTRDSSPMQSLHRLRSKGKPHKPVEISSVKEEKHSHDHEKQGTVIATLDPNMEPSVTVDMSISPASGSFPQEDYTALRKFSSEQERSITFSIPSLQELAREEEEESEKSEEMSAEVELKCQVERKKQCTISAGVAESMEASESLDMSLSPLSTFSLPQETDNTLRNIASEQDRSITFSIPSLQELAQEEEEDEMEIRGMDSVGMQLRREVPSSPVKADQALQLEATTNPTIGEGGEVYESDMSMEIVDDTGEPTLNSRSLTIGETSQFPAAGSGKDKQTISGTGDWIVLSGSAACVIGPSDPVNMTPTSNSEQSMEMVEDDQGLISLSDSTKILERLDMTTPTACLERITENVGVTQDTMLLSDDEPNMKVAQDLEIRTSNGCSEQSLSLVGDTEDKSSRDHETSSPDFSPSKLAMEEVKEEPTSTLSPSSQDKSLQGRGTSSPFELSRSKMAIEEVNEEPISILPSASREDEIINLPSRSRSSPTTLAHVTSITHSQDQSDFGSPRTIPSHRLASAAQTYVLEKPENSTLKDAAFTAEISPARSGYASRVGEMHSISQPPISAISTVKRALSITPRTRGAEEDRLSSLRKRVASQLTRDNLQTIQRVDEPTETIKLNHVQGTFPHTNPLPGEPLGSKEVANISVEEFLKLAEIWFELESPRNIPELAGAGKKEMHSLHDRLRFGYLGKAQVRFMRDACESVQGNLQKMRISTAMLEEILTVSNPPIFWFLQTADADVKQRIKKKLEQVQANCRLSKRKFWIQFRMSLEEERSYDLREIEKDALLGVEQIAKAKKMLDKSYQRFLRFQAKVSSKASFRAPKAVDERSEENPLHKCSSDHVDYLRERLNSLKSSAEAKAAQLQRRAQIAEDSLRTLNLRVAVSKSRVQELVTKLADNVCKRDPHVAKTDVISKPEIHVKTMTDKVDILQMLQDGWQIVSNDREGAVVVVEHSYGSLIKQRFRVLKDGEVANVLGFSWGFDATEIEMTFPRMNALEAFRFTLTARSNNVSRKPTSLNASIQGTRFLVSSLMELLEEVGKCQGVVGATAGGAVLVTARFLSETEDRLLLELKFIDCLLAVKFFLMLDMSCLRRNEYPFGAFRGEVEMKYCSPSIPERLTKAAIEAAVGGVKPGYYRLERTCAAVGSLLASFKNPATQ